MEERKPIFICEFNNCEKIFTTKYSLLRHTLTHSKKKAFKCKECDKKFSIKQNLVEHEFVHTGELPYVWNFNGCTERFRQRGKLSLHRQSHKSYQKKSYRSHVNINEGENKVREPSVQSGEQVNNIQTQNCLLQNCITRPACGCNNMYLMNSLNSKMNQFSCSNTNIIRLNQSMPNGSYQVIRTSFAPINIQRRPQDLGIGSNGVLPKLSVVLMPNNQLGCRMN